MQGAPGIHSRRARVFTHVGSSAVAEAASPSIDPSPCPLAEATAKRGRVQRGCERSHPDPAGLRKRSAPEGRSQARGPLPLCRAFSRPVPSPSMRTRLWGNRKKYPVRVSGTFLCVHFKDWDAAVATFSKARGPAALKLEDSCKVARIREAGKKAPSVPRV
ncbi:hypothetical protein NN561_016540 [Cricetulus griseus]